MRNLVTRASLSLRRRWTHARGNDRIRRLNREIIAHAAPRAGEAPVIFFNASTRLLGMSLNAAYNLITSWAVQLAGAPVIYFVCEGGLSPCVLGTNRDNPAQPPPCAGCIAQSRAVYPRGARTFHFAADPQLAQAVAGLLLPELCAFTYQGAPLGALVLPSIRWILRRHTLNDDEPTRALYSRYILSAWQVVQEFSRLLEETHPQAVVVFNGMFYPEAAARWVAWQRKLPVISHEVGLLPNTAYFTPGDATAYPIHIPESFELSPAQNQRLDAYLENRMQGNFMMAGIRFWPEMRGLDQDFLDKAAAFGQVVPVFTNVIFDTSQPHSNVVFSDMFAWLDLVADLARAYPQTLFVIRAHPDEARPGKESRESVAAWVKNRRVLELHNVVFVEPQQYFSSYELIQRSKFVMVYNSTIGLEASIMGAAVLCGGKARFTQIPTVFFPETPQAYREMAQQFLSADSIAVPPEFCSNARRFMYFQLYRTSLPFTDFIEEDGIWKGYVRVKNLDHRAFDPGNAPVLKTVVDGILLGKEFLLEE